MSQADIIKELKKKDWMSAKELNKKLKMNSANTSLLKLYKQGVVERVKYPLEKYTGFREYRYKLKII